MSKIKVGFLIVAGFVVTAVTAGLIGSGAAIALTRAANQPSPDVRITGYPVDVPSAILGETVTVNVRLPVGRSKGDGPLPAFWVTDGSHQGAHFMQSVESLSRIGLTPPAIVVDIPSTSQGRSLDFRPSVPGRAETNAEDFLAFIRTEVMPAVAEEFDLGGPDVFVGYSLGGLFASWAFTQDPDAFDGWIAFSPSWWYEDQMMVDVLSDFVSSGPDIESFFFASLGTAEGSGMQSAFDRVNQAVGEVAPPGLDWVVSETEGAGHGNNPQLSAARAIQAFSARRVP